MPLRVRRGREEEPRRVRKERVVRFLEEEEGSGDRERRISALERQRGERKMLSRQGTVETVQDLEVEAVVEGGGEGDDGDDAPIYPMASDGCVDWGPAASSTSHLFHPREGGAEPCYLGQVAIPRTLAVAPLLKDCTE